jgi:DNA-directed RNA polymerase specialized sigma24 family protein
MNVVDHCLPSARLDRAVRSSRVRAVNTTDLLCDQDWSQVQKNLTLFALGRIHKRSLHLAQDLAQTAIADLLTRPESWDPEKEPLGKHLAKRVIGLTSNEWARKRSTLEVLCGNLGNEDGPDASDGEEPTDDVLDSRRVAARFRARLDAHFAGDEDATLAVTFMGEGYSSVAALAKVTGVPKERMHAARRRVVYQARLIAREMSEELDAVEDARAGLVDEKDDDEESCHDE